MTVLLLPRRSTRRSVTYAQAIFTRGLLLAANGRSLTVHVTEMCRKEMFAAWPIKSPHHLCLAAVINIYEKHNMWKTHYLERSHSKKFQTKKAIQSLLPPKSISLDRVTGNHLVYLLGSSPLLSEDLRRCFEHQQRQPSRQILGHGSKS